MLGDLGYGSGRVQGWISIAGEGDGAAEQQEMLHLVLPAALAPWGPLMGPAPPQLSPYSRVYPVVPTNARVFYEKDIIIGDYHFPKNVSEGHALGSPAVLNKPRQGALTPFLAP